MEIFATTDVDKMRHDGHFWAIMLLLCGLVQGGTAFIQSALFGYAAEKLTTRLRTSLFCNIMRMDIGYFDMPTHSSGKISTRLATDTPNVKSAIDFRLGAVIAALVSIVCGLFISFYYNWATSLLVLGIFPLAVLGRSLQLRYLKEIRFQNMFLSCLLGPHKQAKKDAIVQGLIYGFSSSILYFIFAACYRFGLWLILDHNTPPMHIMKVLMAVSFSMGSISFATAYIPEYKKARLAAGLIFKMLGDEPNIDSLATDGQKREIKGFVHFKELQFVYPERPKVKILKGLDISVEPGQTLALVGSSGCGKSTLISLLERFYDPNGGEVILDGSNLQDLNIEHVRSNMALVSQEPILFDCSIRENILYGLDPKTVSMERIQQAAQLANIESFVKSLPAGYETRVGEKGTQLSGGQKQRIAIARALIRNPKILLLDEATSALDTESEKIVQEALDRASEGRTCIIIAHRLSTVVNADCIAVVKDGVILEKGTHSQLMAMRGAYFNLTQKQIKHPTSN
uniref:Uncharacterized protein n=1 Tax=Panagrolaimus sp. PS1159 TaxID=55785 RepID=A0AC35GNH9_9BILA